MATIRHSLQKEVFDVTAERLIGILHVTKPGKKKNRKISFLCAVINKEKPVYAYIHQVKETEKDSFKKKCSWPLLELQTVDGKDENKETPEFDLQIDRVYKWIASSVPEKHSFIQVLWKLCCLYLPKQKPQFINIPHNLIKEDVSQTEVIIAPGLGQVDVEDDSDFCALSEREQIDLERLMLQCDSAVSNAEAFADQLSKDLTMLDGANIHSMMASEVQVRALMDMIDSALTEADKIETRLNGYDDILLHVKDSIEKMAEKNLSIEQTNANNRQLLQCLAHVIDQLSFPSHHEKYLTHPDFQVSNLHPLIEAATILETVINAPIPQHLENLQAVKEQKKKFEKLRSDFSKHLARNLNNLFIHHGNDPGESLSLHAELLTLPRHSRIHSELMPYAPLMQWMHQMDIRSFNKLKQTYANAMSKLYERDIKVFFDEAKNRISGGKRLRGSGSNQDIASMSAVAGKLQQTLSTRVGAGGALLGIDRDQWGGELDGGERQKFDQIFEQVLSELEPVCLAEQEFCSVFFSLTQSESKSTSHASTPGSNNSNESPVGSGGSDSSRRFIRTVNKDVRSMMSELFSNLEPQITSFINTFFRADSYCCLYIYVRLSEHVLSAEDTGSFLSIAFGSSLIQAKRNYDNFMGLQLNSIRECRVTRKKCGILPFITNFELFAQTAESVFRKSERRGDLDKWYTALIHAMFEQIPIVAKEHQKTPEEHIKMENYHVLRQLLSQLKLRGLESQRKEAKQRYQDSLSAYVTQYFGRPLEKLNHFFEGVETRVAGGVKESEIGYQMAYSKVELRKVIKEYPGKEVKKGLEQLYKKVEKHQSEDGNLLQVVWIEMQKEFICQYKHIDDLIHRCYPGAMVSLEFSIDDILKYFSDIAQSH